jgi:hypothetical protein
MIALGQKHGSPSMHLGMKGSLPSHSLGQKVVGKRDHTLNIQHKHIHQSPIEKLARSNQALGQYA